MGDFKHFVRRGALGVVASCMLLATGAAQGPTPSRAAIDRAIGEMRADCEGKLRLGDGFETKAEINGDGIQDVVLNLGALSCQRLDMDGTSAGYCGSAGCVHRVFVSTPRGYVFAFNDNIHEWSVDRGKSPPQLLLTMHGSACDRVGADVCRKALVWNGSRMVDAASVRAAAPAVAPTRGAARPAVWRAQQDARGYRIARADGTAPVTGMALTCEGRTPYLAVHLTPSPRARTATLALSADARSANVRLANIGRNQTWAAQVGGNGVVDLLASGADRAALTLDGRAAGAFDLAGAREAIGAALAACHRLAAASAGAAQPNVPFRPVPTAAGGDAGLVATPLASSGDTPIALKPIDGRTLLRLRPVIGNEYSDEPQDPECEGCPSPVPARLYAAAIRDDVAGHDLLFLTDRLDCSAGSLGYCPLTLYIDRGEFSSGHKFEGSTRAQLSMTVDRFPAYVRREGGRLSVIHCTGGRPFWWEFAYRTGVPMNPDGTERKGELTRPGALRC